MKFNRLALGVLFLISGLSLFSQKKTVQISLKYTESYCGGARPTDEMLAEIQKPKAYANKMIVLISAKGKVDSVRTNKLGAFKKKLAVGQYKIMEAWRFYKSTPNGGPLDHFDKACLKLEWERTALELVVTKKTNTVDPKNEIILYCEWAYPCLLESHTPPIPQ